MCILYKSWNENISNIKVENKILNVENIETGQNCTKILLHEDKLARVDKR